MLGSVAFGALLSRRHLWIWPVTAAIVLAALGWFLHATIESRMKTDLASQLQTLLDADVKALELWLRSQEVTATAVANDHHVQQHAERLVELGDAHQDSALPLLQSPEMSELRQELAPVIEANKYKGWILVSPALRIVASQRNEQVGIQLPSSDVAAVREKVLNGRATVSSPRKSVSALPDRNGELKVGVATMFAWAPVRNGEETVIAALGLRIPPEQDFTNILGIGRAGTTGETYAVNRDGRLISDSRFEEGLRRIGLLKEDENSILNIEIRDPGVDLTKNNRTGKLPSELPLTRLAESLTRGESGYDVEGYRDYRGVDSVGAWKWLDEYDLGVGTEQDQAEALAPLYLLRKVFWGLFALVGAAAVAIFLFSVMIAYLNREARRAAVVARQLGQYTLDEKLGEGGMGVVYRAHHAMLQRPTAVKFLNAEATNERSIARFEREVRLTAKLTHPNTIAIYDYGRSPEGVFYYAMEYLEGINLEELVDRYGPQSEARTVAILKQVCGSLAEAHRHGLIHRDIKPANIMLTERGGIYDYVKLLDFGLVKAVDADQEAKLTAAGSLTGTPLYLSPEAIHNPESVDGRSDLYAVGAVGYFLLTGTPVFQGNSVLDIVQKHASHPPEQPSARLGQSVSPALESLILNCLAKRRDDRPKSADDLADALSQIVVDPPWTTKDAALWWEANKLAEQHHVDKFDTADSHQIGTVVGQEVKPQTPVAR
ncbi:MAG: serine/threonine protein kinase [Planctomycetales bacterium]